jgi:integrase
MPRPKKQKRRGDGEGTVFFDKSRGKWIASLPPDELSGKRPRRLAASQAEAIVLLRQMEAERARGATLTEKNPTLAQFLDLWLKDVVAPNKRPSTTNGYRDVLTSHVYPTIGRKRVKELTHALVQRWVNDLAQRRAPSTVRRAYARLRPALDVAVRWYKLAGNPADGVELPPLGASKAQPLTIAQVQALFVAVGDWRLAALIYALVLLGLRRGEALGLAWRDYDREAQTIAITQQVQDYRGKLTISSLLKTDAARRIVPVPPMLAAMLTALWETLQQERRLDGWQEHQLIFPAENGKPKRPRALSLAFKGFCAKAGTPVRLHDLRHTCATLLGEQGASEAVIAALLGHTPSTITRHYAHVGIAQMREAVEGLERALCQEAAQEADGNATKVYKFAQM